MEIRKSFINRTNTNFKGAFILKNANQSVKDKVPHIIKQGRQIFYNIKHDGDIVLVVRDKYDKRVCEFINNEKTAFEYYPEISTKSGLDDEIPEGLKKLLNTKNNCVISNLNILNKFLLSGVVHLNRQIEYLQEALNTLRLNVEKLKIKIDNKGIFVIRDEQKQRTIKSSGIHGGCTYVCVIPDSKWQETERFLVGRNGKEIIKEYNTPNEILEFNKKFKKIIAK